MIKDLNLKFKIKENPQGIKREMIILQYCNEVVNYAEKHGNQAVESQDNYDKDFW